MSEYTCARCGGVFTSDWTEEEAQKECEMVFTPEGRAGPKDSVCDDCYQEFMEWMRAEHPDALVWQP